jgi:hypothetical protein
VTSPGAKAGNGLPPLTRLILSGAPDLPWPPAFQLQLETKAEDRSDQNHAAEDGDAEQGRLGGQPS